jgi:hypothetical protein
LGPEWGLGAISLAEARDLDRQLSLNVKVGIDPLDEKHSTVQSAVSMG